MESDLMNAYNPGANGRESNFIIAMLLLHRSDTPHAPPRPCPFCDDTMSLEKETKLFNISEQHKALVAAKIHATTITQDPYDVPVVQELPRFGNCGEMLSIRRDNNTIAVLGPSYELEGSLRATTVFRYDSMTITYFKESIKAKHTIKPYGTTTVENGNTKHVSEGIFPGSDQPHSLWSELKLTARLRYGLEYLNDKTYAKSFKDTIAEFKNLGVEVIISKSENDSKICSVKMTPPKGCFIFALVSCYCNGISLYLVKEPESGFIVGTKTIEF
jgi:hypothetical protein